VPRLSAEARRAALVEAAVQVMSRQGLAAGTTRAIAAEAGMSLASFHYAFASRDELLRELVPRVVGHELSAATVDLPAGAGPAEYLRAAAAGYLDHLEREPGATMLMFELAMHSLRDPALRPLARQQYRAYTAAATRLLEEISTATGVAWRRPAAELARLLVTLIDGATTTWLIDRDTAATRAVLDAGVELFVAQQAEPRA
jgi:AcrR family transcriptional regulator